MVSVDRQLASFEVDETTSRAILFLPSFCCPPAPLPALPPLWLSRGQNRLLAVPTNRRKARVEAASTDQSGNGARILR